MFPDDSTLIARGKYSTLNHERREQIKRAQKIVETMQAKLYTLVQSIQTPEPAPDLSELRTCLDNLQKASSLIEDLCMQMQELRDIAWAE